MLLRIIALGSDEGWELLEADTDQNGAEQAALAELEAAVVAISRYWRGQWRRQSAEPRQPSIGPRSLGVGRNEPCPCGSGRKYKRLLRERPSLRISVNASPTYPPARALRLCACPSVDSSRR